MSSGLLVALELLLVAGLALGWGAYELISLRRDRRRRRDEDER